MVLRHERWWVVNVILHPRDDDGAPKPLPGREAKKPAAGGSTEDKFVRVWVAKGMAEHDARRHVREMLAKAPKPKERKRRGR